MTALRSSSTLMRRFARPNPLVFRLRPLTAPAQRRSYASTLPRFQQEQTEGAEAKKSSPFDLAGKVFVVTGTSCHPPMSVAALLLSDTNISTGGGNGLALCMAEGLAEAGGKVHCLDRIKDASEAFQEAQARVSNLNDAGLEYHSVDVTHDEAIRKCIADIAANNQRLDGLIAGRIAAVSRGDYQLTYCTAAAIQQVTPALDFKKEDISKMLEVNYTGVFLTARECARQMMNYKIQGSICLVASMSGTIANRGFLAPVYNSSKAAVVQLARNLAMEWGRKNPDGSGGIRVNSLSPGHIVTPMVQANFDAGEANREEWENNSMLGRLSKPEEYKGVGVFMLSNASSYMTGHDLKIDGGTTAW